MTTRNDKERLALPPAGEVPLIGFGTWQLEGDEAYNGVRAALDIGYRHIDTATGYVNEDRVGAAVRDSGLGRDEIFVTTKFPPERAGHELETLEESLSLLGMEFVDLWLVHWPPGGQARPETWEQFIVAQQQGKARAIGVSNYSIDQVDELIKATGQVPALNQIPWSPFSYDPATVVALAERGVLLEGYSPIKNSSLDHPVLVDIAALHGKTPAQVILRWHIEHGFIVIPRSARRARIEENFDLYDFELAEDEVHRLDALSS
jgi:2,5-diketo-D-gluconate reductase A